MIQNVLPRYTAMGTWKSKVIRKRGKASRTGSGRPRLFIAVPPAEGWKGGRPEENGYRGRKG